MKWILFVIFVLKRAALVKESWRQHEDDQRQQGPLAHLLLLREEDREQGCLLSNQSKLKRVRWNFSRCYKSDGNRNLTHWLNLKLCQEFWITFFDWTLLKCYKCFVLNRSPYGRLWRSLRWGGHPGANFNTSYVDCCKKARPFCK